MANVPNQYLQDHERLNLHHKPDPFDQDHLASGSFFFTNTIPFQTSLPQFQHLHVNPLPTCQLTFAPATTIFSEVSLANILLPPPALVILIPDDPLNPEPNP